jgi:hypothetical protein
MSEKLGKWQGIIYPSAGTNIRITIRHCFLFQIVNFIFPTARE